MPCPPRQVHFYGFNVGDAVKPWTDKFVPRRTTPRPVGTPVLFCWSSTKGCLVSARPLFDRHHRLHCCWVLYGADTQSPDLSHSVAHTLCNISPSLPSSALPSSISLALSLSSFFFSSLHPQIQVRCGALRLQQHCRGIRGHRQRRRRHRRAAHLPAGLRLGRPVLVLCWLRRHAWRSGVSVACFVCRGWVCCF